MVWVGGNSRFCDDTVQTCLHGLLHHALGDNNTGVTQEPPVAAATAVGSAAWDRRAICGTSFRDCCESPHLQLLNQLKAPRLHDGPVFHDVHSIWTYVLQQPFIVCDHE